MHSPRLRQQGDLPSGPAEAPLASVLVHYHLQGGNWRRRHTEGVRTILYFNCLAGLPKRACKWTAWTAALPPEPMQLRTPHAVLGHAAQVFVTGLPATSRSEERDRMADRLTALVRRAGGGGEHWLVGDGHYKICGAWQRPVAPADHSAQ